VLRFQTHCCDAESQRKPLSGVVETTASLTLLTAVPPRTFTKLIPVTTAPVPTEWQLASNTANFTGTVLPCLKTLLPSTLIGCKITWPGTGVPFKVHIAPAGRYGTGKANIVPVSSLILGTLVLSKTTVAKLSVFEGWSEVQLGATPPLERTGCQAVPVQYRNTGCDEPL